MWSKTQREGRKYRYRNTKWFGQLSNSNHSTIEVQYWHERLGSWRPSINWKAIDYCVSIRNQTT